MGCLREKAFFERAIFISWYCSKADCSFCYMSTQKESVGEPSRAKRRFSSIFSEAIISRECGWKLEFLSGGCDSFSVDELVFIAKTLNQVFGEKIWLNIGTLKRPQLERLAPYIEGVIGTVECITPFLRDEICPSKPLSEIISTFGLCDELGLKKGVTIIIGLGEKIGDWLLLKGFIEENGVSRITFYSLNPQKGTPFNKSPGLEYYSGWIKKTRDSFPDIHITAGAWHDKTNYFSKLLEAGADNITKFPALKKFGSKEAAEVERQARLAKREFAGSLTTIPGADWEKIVFSLDIGEKLKHETLSKLQEYLLKMKK